MCLFLMMGKVMPEEIAGFMVYSMREILNMPNNPQATIVEKLIYRNGKTVLVGKPKLGKSWLALKLGISTANGDSILGFNTKMSPVLYLEFDRRFLRNTIGRLTDKPTGNWYLSKLPALALNEKKGMSVVDKIIRITQSQ